MNDHGHVDHEECDLVGLLAGELGRDAFGHSARHLKTCRDCSEELTDLVIAHGALTSAARTGLGAVTLPALEPPAPDADPLPPIARPRRRRHGVLAAAAAVIALAAIGTTAARVWPSSTPPSTQPVVARVALRPLDAPPTASGSVTVVARGSTRELTVRTEHLTRPPVQSFYEVWLLDPTTLKMLPMGVLPPSGSGSYTVVADIMSGYSAVDVSLQANDGDPAHSQTSVLRAAYAVTTT